MQREPIVTRALVWTGCVLALVLATTVVDGTLVHICENDVKNEVIDDDLTLFFSTYTTDSGETILLNCILQYQS